MPNNPLLDDSLISIIVISYNHAKYLKECLDSCLNQSYNKIEVIVSDDNSSDGSQGVIKTYVNRYPSIVKAVLSSCNYGIAKTFNSAILACSGEWVKVIACDDKLRVECVRVFSDEIKAKGISHGIIFSNMSRFTPDGKSRTVTPCKNFFELDQSGKVRSLLISNQLTAPSSFLHRRSIIEIGLADERFAMIEDYPLWLKAAQKNLPFYYIDRVTVDYREYESVSNSKKTIGNLRYYSSVRSFARSEIWPKRSGYVYLKNIDDFVYYNMIIYSIIFFVG